MASDFDYTSTTVPPGALFVAAAEPLLIYPSVLAAQRHLEANDVEDGVYPAGYGPNGEPFRISCEGKRVVIESIGEPNRPDELRRLLVGHLEAIGRPPDTTASLDDLTAAAWTVESEFWQENDPYGDRFSKPLPGWCCLALLLVPVPLLFGFVTKSREPLIGILIAALILWPVGVLAKRRADQTNF